MKYTQSTKALLMLLATSGLIAIALPAAAENNGSTAVEREKTAAISTGEAAKSKTISDLQAFERNKTAASHSLEQKLQAFTAEIADEDGVLAQILSSNASIATVADETLEKEAAFLKPMQVHRPATELERLPIEDSVFLKPMQVHRPAIELERLPVEDSVFLKPMQVPPAAN